MNTKYVDIIKNDMVSAINVYKEELDGIRTGRVTQAFLNPVVVKVYGSNMPISQIASINTQDRMLVIQVWDAENVAAIQKAIIAAELGVTPTVEGSSIRILIPPMTEERREQMVKASKKCAERAKIAVRNIRRNTLEQLKRNAKDEGISDDEKQKISDKIQKETDEQIKLIDNMLADKEKEIIHT